MKEKIKSVVAFLLVTAFIVFLVWLSYSPPKTIRYYERPIKGTTMKIHEVETTFYGCEDTSVESYYYLLNAKGDTLARQGWFGNPFVNACGIVYIPRQGIYDCRGEKPSVIIQNADLKYPVRIDSIAKDKVYITCGNPSLNLMELRVDYSDVKNYVYDLNEKRVSSLK